VAAGSQFILFGEITHMRKAGVREEKDDAGEMSEEEMKKRWRGI